MRGPTNQSLWPSSMVALILAAPLSAEVRPRGLEARQGVNLTGEWTGFCPKCPAWRLSQSGTVVTASWRGGPGHESLVGQFRGNLIPRGQTTYVEGRMNLTEGAVRVSGTVTMILRSPNEIDVSYVQENGYRGNATLHRGGHDAYRPIKIDISYHANNLPTEPPFDGVSCPGAEQRARITGKITAQIREIDLVHEGGGDVAATPHWSRCRVPVINLAVDKVELRVLTPGSVLQATLSVHITQEGVHRPGSCQVGTRGTIVATFDETSRAANALPNHSLQIGPWESPCGAHNHVITNNLSTITADASSSTWVRMWIACKGEGTGFAPKYCT